MAFPMARRTATSCAGSAVSSRRGRARIGRGETRHQRLEEDRHGHGRRGGYDARGGGDGAGAAVGEVRHEVMREVDGEVGRGGRGRRGEELEREHGDVLLVGGKQRWLKRKRRGRG